MPSFKLPTTLLEYLNLLQGTESSLPLWVATPMIMSMIEIQYSGIARLSELMHTA